MDSRIVKTSRPDSTTKFAIAPSIGVELFEVVIENLFSRPSVAFGLVSKV